MANPKKRKVSSPEKMSASLGSIATSAIENFFEDKDFERLFESSEYSELDEDSQGSSAYVLDDLEGEFFDALEEMEDFDLN